MTSVFVEVGGREVAWKSVTLSRSLEAALGSASVNLALDADVPVTPGDRMRVVASGPAGAVVENLLVGFVDSSRITGSSTSTELELAGRDRTSDFVDGIRLDGESTWYQSTLLQIARDLAFGFGLEVLDEVGAAEMPIGNHLAQPGESAYAVLERAARLHGVLITTTPAGQLLLGRPRGARVATPLRTGPEGRVRSWTYSNDASKRFRRYQVRAQPGITGLARGLPSFPAALAEDDTVRDQREKVIVTQGDLVGDEVERLARWHATVSRARSVGVTVEVTSWRSEAGGGVWRPGMLAAVEIPEIELVGELLVSGIGLAYDESGERASITLVRPDAFEVDPSQALRLSRNLGALL